MCARICQFPTTKLQIRSKMQFWIYVTPKPQKNLKIKSGRHLNTWFLHIQALIQAPKVELNEKCDEFKSENKKNIALKLLWVIISKLHWQTSCFFTWIWCCELLNFALFSPLLAVFHSSILVSLASSFDSSWASTAVVWMRESFPACAFASFLCLASSFALTLQALMAVWMLPTCLRCWSRLTVALVILLLV